MNEIADPFQMQDFFPFFPPQAILIKASGISKQIVSDVCVCLPHSLHPHIFQANLSQVDGISGEKTEALSSEIISSVVCDKELSLSFIIKAIRIKRFKLI